MGDLRFNVGDIVRANRLGCVMDPGTVTDMDFSGRLNYRVEGEINGVPGCALWCAGDDLEIYGDGLNKIAFDIGDVVTLRSGGPYMTVSLLNGTEIGCVWFDKQDVQHTAFFPTECIYEDEE